MKDFYWLNDNSRSFLESRYLLEGETAEQRIQDIAVHAEHVLGINGFAKRFYSNMARGYYSIASPIWANFGRSRGMPVSCFGSYLTDDVGSILQATAEVGAMSSLGGGCSLYMGNLRGRGEKIGNGQGESTGASSFVEIFDSLTGVIKQGGVRRGHASPYLDIDHPDFPEFVQIGSDENPIQSTNHGIIVSDDHMERLLNREPEAMERQAMLVKARMNQGFPYVVFEGNMNRGRPQAYKDAGRTIKASNMCVAPETEILTDDGYHQICNLAGETVNVWNGEEWTAAKVEKTGTMQPLMKIVVSNMKTLKCTAYHKFYLADGSEVRAEDLEIGDELLHWTHPSTGQDINGVITETHTLTRYADTYCFNEPKRHMGVFNGILTGQCSEIALSSTPEESFVCILSSMNMAQYDEWKDTDAVETLVQFLEAVTTEFVTKCNNLDEPMRSYMERARRFAENQRALGIGILGWHSYFQQNNWPLESKCAAKANLEVTKTIQERAHAESARLAESFGEPPFMEGTGYRHATLTAIAPTKSSSFILGQVSQGVEPEESNYYVRSTADRQVLIKNSRLLSRLQELGIDTPETWDQIKIDNGSVANVVGLPDHDKKVFKTFREINQQALIDLAAVRQDYVDQSQSLNLAIDTSYTAKDVNALIIHAWQMGVKSLYYQFNVNAAQEMMRNSECEACHA